MISDPVELCQTCGDSEIIKNSDAKAAKDRLEQRCHTAGHPCDAVERNGMTFRGRDV